MGSFLDAQDTIEKLTFARGRVALAAILRSLGVMQGDEVVTQAFTCVAVPEAIMAVGAIPVFADIESDGYNLEPDSLTHCIGPKTRAIVVQHTFGLVADMTRISEIAEEHGLPIIEDCCHSFLSTHGENRIGTIGKASFFSYEWGKPIVCGLGGSAFSEDKEMVEKIGQLRASFAGSSRMQDIRLALQYRVFDILYRPKFFWQLRALFRYLSKIGVAKGNYDPVGEGQISDDFSKKMASTPQGLLKKKLRLTEVVANQSEKTVDQYSRLIAAENVTHPAPIAGTTPVYARYPLRVKSKTKILAGACKAGLEMADWYVSPIHPLGQDDWHKVHYTAGQCPNAERRCDEVISLPTSARVSEDYVTKVTQLLNSSCQRAGKLEKV